jgi:hypothetical protein
MMEARSMLRRSFALSCAVVAATAGAAIAHHGWGSYDASKTLTVQSPVANLRWQNPHVHIDVRHQNADWEAVLAPPFRMEARGLTPAMLRNGAMVTVEGYPSTRTEREMRVERITVGGKVFELR